MNFQATMDSQTETSFALEDGRRMTIGPARPDDALQIRWLYHWIYGGSYPFSLVYNAEECLRALASDKHLWLLSRCDGKVVGSVIFTIDRAIGLGKVFGAVVAEEFRGRDLTERAMAFGLELLMRRERLIQSVYATTRTIGLAPQRLTEKLRQALCAGFLPSAYYPGMRWDTPGGGRDYVVLSRSLAMLDFHGISLQTGYLDYLQEYFRLWRALYVDAALSGAR